MRFTVAVDAAPDPLNDPAEETAVTVIAEVAVFAPSCVVTVMVVVPAATPVTNPVALTVATAVLLLLQLTFLFVALAGAIVAVNCCAPFAGMDADVGLTVTPVTFTVAAVTVIAEVAVFAPSCVVTVIVAVPAATPVTNPAALTVATPVLLLLQLTFWFVALAGAIVAVNCCVPFTVIDAEVGLTVTPVTFTVAAVTVIAEVAVFAPSCVVTVIVAVPAATPVTNPAALTVATLVLLLLQLTFWFVALAGAIVAVNCCVPFAAIEADIGLTVTPVTFTVPVD